MDNLTLTDVLYKVAYLFNNSLLLIKELLFILPSQLIVITNLLHLPTGFVTNLMFITGLNLNLNLNESFNYVKNNMSLDNISKTLFSSENINSYSSSEETHTSELSNNIRFTRFNNPLISYDYKCGNYIGI
jgi:predicted membrane chloride channel (bestrophin family)